MADSNATTAPTTTCAGYFETLSSDTLGHNSLEVTQLYILEDESEINGSHSPFDLLNWID
jgi:hypothetical protein